MTGPGVHTLEVPAGAPTQRVDRYVADVTGLSRSHVQKLISAGNLTAAGMPLKANAVIGPGAARKQVEQLRHLLLQAQGAIGGLDPRGGAGVETEGWAREKGRVHEG